MVNKYTRIVVFKIIWIELNSMDSEVKIPLFFPIDILIISHNTVTSNVDLTQATRLWNNVKCSCGSHKLTLYQLLYVAITREIITQTTEIRSAAIGSFNVTMRLHQSNQSFSF